MMTKHKILVPALAVLLLTACGERISEVEQSMEAIRSRQLPAIEPPPQPQPIEAFEYTAGTLRSPFLAQSLLALQAKAESGEGVKPDLTRAKHPLEEYELEQLIYRGKVVAPNGKEYGLVQLPDGLVREVQVGEYMGKSDGRILEITPTQINLEEIVPDTRAGFVYKRTSLVTP